MKNLSLIVLILWLSLASGQADDARQIIQNVLDRDDGATEVSRVTLSTCSVMKKDKEIICKSSPRVKVMDMIRKDYGPRGKDHKTVTILLKPAGEKGIGFLQYDYEQKEKETDQWLYLSSFGKVKRIVSGNENEPKTGSFFGSELSYEDMEKRHIDEYTYTILGKETYAEKVCTIIESVPVPDRARKSNYSKSLAWVDTSRNIILKTLLYNRQGKKAKRIYYGDIRQVDNILVPHTIMIFNIATSRRTYFTYDKIVLNVDVKDEFLSQRTLTDGAFRGINLKEYQAHF